MSAAKDRVPSVDEVEGGFVQAEKSKRTNVLPWVRAKWEKLGFLTEKTEYKPDIPDGAKFRNPFVTRDLFGFADFVAFCNQPRAHSLWRAGLFLVQVTTKDHVQERIKKILSQPKAHILSLQGQHIYVVGVDNKGKPTELWTMLVYELRFIKDADEDQWKTKASDLHGKWSLTEREPGGEMLPKNTIYPFAER